MKSLARANLQIYPCPSSQTSHPLHSLMAIFFIFVTDLVNLYRRTLLIHTKEKKSNKF